MGDKTPAIGSALAYFLHCEIGCCQPRHQASVTAGGVEHIGSTGPQSILMELEHGSWASGERTSLKDAYSVKGQCRVAVSKPACPRDPHSELQRKGERG